MGRLSQEKAPAFGDVVYILKYIDIYVGWKSIYVIMQFSQFWCFDVFCSKAHFEAFAGSSLDLAVVNA